MVNSSQKGFVIPLILAIVALLAIGGGVFVYESKKVEAPQLSEVIKYGSIEDYFTSQSRIIYPLIFDQIKIFSSQNNPEINFGPQQYNGVEFYMHALKVSKKDLGDYKADAIDKSLYIKEKYTMNGYHGDILINDLKEYPMADSKSCSFSYMYIIPLIESDDVLILFVSVSQPDWGMKPDLICSLFDDVNYNYWKAITNYVIDNVQPTF